jgi:phospholipase C
MKMAWKLTGAVAATALAALGSAAITGVAQGQASPVRHVVVIYLENHSFDNVLGYWCDQLAQHPGGRADGCLGMPPVVTLSDGAVVTPGVDSDTVPNVNHSVQAQVAAMNGGLMNGWQNIPGGSCDAATGYQCISGYEPSQIPNLISLAQHFAISDRTFSMDDSASWGGHLYAVAASLDRFFGDNPIPQKGVTAYPGWGCDSDKVALWRAPNGKLKLMPSCVPDRSVGLRYGGAFEPTQVSQVPTILDRLQAAGLSWKIYGAVKGQAGYGMWDICPTFAACLDTSEDAHLVPDSRFFTDATRGTLPAFSVVTPGGPDFPDACHNKMSMTACDNWVGQLVSAVEASPDWSSTAVFITFDDCGCFYDQVPPPLAPDGTQEGPRVPLIIVSPYARPGYTDTTPTSFAGILAYTEHNFGLQPLGVNDASAYGFADAFDYSQVPLRPVRMITRALPASARHLRLTRALLNDPT